ncbi:stalk domain-containing protein [Bacillus sp. FJAT-45350]|uniref:stalk domain-containing protein n=1 Tax=Bacillus sp. FJAT-45350 TaxID=2011014 RepID=UPI0015C6FE41|nr:stalk domain-containing protein [Bacillus sp. FJAT-45350]
MNVSLRLFLLIFIIAISTACGQNLGLDQQQHDQSTEQYQARGQQALFTITPQELDIIIRNNKVRMDVEPFIDNNFRTMVPVRFVTEELGYFVHWEPATRKVIIKGDKDIELIIGQNTALVNNNRIQMDTQAVLSNQRTFVPLRFISESLGNQVEWFQQSRTIGINLTNEARNAIHGQLTTPVQPPITGCVNINQANSDQLTSIIHIDSERANEIIRLRPFNSLNDLTRVRGIGPARVNDITNERVACIR